MTFYEDMQHMGTCEAYLRTVDSDDIVDIGKKTLVLFLFWMAIGIVTL